MTSIVGWSEEQRVHLSCLFTQKESSMPKKKKTPQKPLPKKQVKKTTQKAVPAKNAPFVTGQRDTNGKGHVKQLVRAFVIAAAILIIPLGLYAYDRFSSNPSFPENKEQFVIHDTDRSGEINSEISGEPVNDTASADTEVLFTAPPELKPQALPFTSSREEYVVQKGDTVYSISIRICEDQSFYINNMRLNYLKVGATIAVDCAE